MRTPTSKADRNAIALATNSTVLNDNSYEILHPGLGLARGSKIARLQRTAANEPDAEAYARAHD